MLAELREEGRLLAVVDAVATRRRRHLDVEALADGDGEIMVDLVEEVEDARADGAVRTSAEFELRGGDEVRPAQSALRWAADALLDVAQRVVEQARLGEVVVLAALGVTVRLARARTLNLSELARSRKPSTGS